MSVGETPAVTADCANQRLRRVPMLSALRRRARLIILVFVGLALFFVLPVWIFSRPEYSSTAYVKVEPVAFQILYKLEDQTIPQYDQFLNTQVTVIRSPKVIERALEQRAVRSTHWFREQPPWNPLGEAPTLQERFRDILTITPVLRTQLIQLTATTKMPQDAVAIVNALTDQYLKLNEESVSAADRARVDALEAQLAEHVARMKSLRGDRNRVVAQLGTDQPGELRTKYKMRELELRTKLSDLDLAEKSCQHELQQLRAGNLIVDKEKSESARSNEVTGDGKPANSSQPVIHDRAYFERELDRIHSDCDDLRTAERDAAQQVALAGKLTNELAELDEQLTQAKATQDYIETRLNALQVEGKAPSRITIASPGSLENVPASDDRVSMSLVLACIALLISLGIGYVRGAFRSAVFDARDLTQSLQAGLLGEIPLTTESHCHPSDDGKNFMTNERVRMIRTALLHRLRMHSAKMVAVASPASGEGSSDVSLMLACSLTEYGKRVLVVDADMEHRGLTKSLGYHDVDGLSGLLDEKTATATIQFNELGFHFLPAGKIMNEGAPQPFGCGRLADAIQKWRAEFDVVIVDCPAVLASAVAGIMGSMSDGVVLVLAAGQTSRWDAVGAWKVLKTAGVPILGSILVGSSHLTRPTNRYEERARAS